jgi:hypothetical protein
MEPSNVDCYSQHWMNFANGENLRLTFTTALTCRSRVRGRSCKFQDIAMSAISLDNADPRSLNDREISAPVAQPDRATDF